MNVIEDDSALLALRDEGLVRAVGAGAKDVDVLIDLVGRGGLDLVMLAGRFTLLEQPALPVLVPLCLRMGVGIVNVGVFNGGILATPRAAPGAQYEYRDAPPAVIARANRIAGVCERFGVSLPAAAAQFGLRARAVVNATFGLRTPEQVNQLAAWLEEPFDDGIWEALAYQGLLPADVVRASSAVRDGGSCHGRASTSCPDLRIFKAADLRDRYGWRIWVIPVRSTRGARGGWAPGSSLDCRDLRPSPAARLPRRVRSRRGEGRRSSAEAVTPWR